MAWAGAADLLRAVSGAADPDAGEGRSQPRCRSPASAARCCSRRSRCRCCASRCGPCSRAPRSMAPPSPRSSRARPAGRPMWRSPSPAICSATSGWRWPRSRWSPSSRWSTCSASRVLAHYASPEKRSAGSIVMTVVRNPLIWACAIGLALNVTHIPLPKLWHEVADALGRSSLAIGLLGDRRRPASRRPVPAEPRRLGRRVPQAGADAGDRGGAGAAGSASPVPTSPS